MIVTSRHDLIIAIMIATLALPSEQESLANANVKRATAVHV